MTMITIELCDTLYHALSRFFRLNCIMVRMIKCRSTVKIHRICHHLIFFIKFYKIEIITWRDLRLDSLSMKFTTFLCTYKCLNGEMAIFYIIHAKLNKPCPTIFIDDNLFVKY